MRPAREHARIGLRSLKLRHQPVVLSMHAAQTLFSA